MHRLSHYELRRIIGTGGLADVWLAVDERTGGDVAIKRLRDVLSGAERALLTREASILGRTCHPHVVELLEVVEDDGHVGLVMELCVGSMEGWVRAHGPLPPATVAEVGIQMLSGLSHAHERRVLHLDIKPANLLVATDGTVKLTDFGIATVTERIDSMTQSSALWGTLPFLAPERRYGWAVTAATDLYAAAMTLAWLATGTALGELHVPATEERLRDRVPAALADVLVKGAQYSADQRYASAGAMRAALESAQTHLGSAEVDLTAIPDEPALDTIGPSRPAKAEARASRAMVGVLGAAATVAGLGAGVSGWALLRAPDPVAEIPSVSAASVVAADPPLEPSSLPRCDPRASETRPIVKLGPRETVGGVVADADDDGHVDLLFTNQLDESLTIYWGGTEPLMSQSTALPIGRSNAAATVGDIDEDGLLDILTTHQDEAAFAVHRGLGDRRFAAPERTFQAPTSGRASLVDWDGDGHLDLLLAVDNGGHCTAWRKGRADGTFDGHVCIGPLAPAVQPFGEDPVAVYRIDEEGRFVRHRPAVSSLMGPPEVLLTPQQIGGELGAHYFAGPSGMPDGPDAFVVAHTVSRELVIAVWGGVESSRTCVYVEQQIGSPTTIVDIADVNADGLADLVSTNTCSGCQSNHIVSLAFP